MQTMIVTCIGWLIRLTYIFDGEDYHIMIYTSGEFVVPLHIEEMVFKGHWGP